MNRKKNNEAQDGQRKQLIFPSLDNIIINFSSENGGDRAF